MEHARNDIAREGLDGVVVIEHRIVVALTHVADLVFGVGEFSLELLEVGVRLQVGVGLRNREKALQRASEHVVCFHLRFGCGSCHNCIARLCYRFEGAAFMRSVSLHGLDKIGDQVQTALQLHIDLRPSIVNTVA